jgi:hypothetical protein
MSSFELDEQEAMAIWIPPTPKRELVQGQAEFPVSFF